MTFEMLTQPEVYVSLLTLTAMEIVLGIDNVVFISILSGKLPPSEQLRVRRIGLSLALILRLALLFAISWLMGLTAPLFSLFCNALFGRHILLLRRGLALVSHHTSPSYRE